MKKQSFFLMLTALVLSLTLTVILGSCAKEPPAPVETASYTVTFDSNGGSKVEPKIVLKGEKVADPGAPTREGYVFVGWMHNDAKWNFAIRSVQEDITLTAKWYAAEIIFSFELIEETGTARLTKLKEKLETLEIPTVISGYPVTEIGAGLFQGLYSNQVSTIFVPASVTTVGAEAFRDLDGIAVVFDENCALTSIGEDAFSGCTGLTDVPLGEGLTEIAAWSFSGCTSLREIHIPASVTAIRENALGGCTALRSVVMSESVTLIEDSAFEDCDALKNLYFYGTEQQIDELLEEKTANMNQPLLNAEIYLYAASKPEAAGAYGGWYFDANGKIKIW